MCPALRREAPLLAGLPWHSPLAARSGWPACQARGPGPCPGSLLGRLSTAPADHFLHSARCPRPRSRCCCLAPPGAESRQHRPPTLEDACCLHAQLPARGRPVPVSCAPLPRLSSRAAPAGRRRNVSPALLGPAGPWPRPGVPESAGRVDRSAQAPDASVLTVLEAGRPRSRCRPAQC